MTQTEELRLKCLKLAASYLSAVSSDLPTFISWAQTFYDFVAEQPAQVTSDPETPYEVSYIAEAPTGAVSREWLCEKLMNMLESAKTDRRVALDSGHTHAYRVYDGQCDAFKAVIDLINPKKDA